MNDYIESLLVRIKLNNRDRLFGVVYHRPQSSFDSFLTLFHTILSYIQSSKLKCYITREFNIDILKYDSDNRVQSFFNQLYEYCFSLLY